MQARAERGIVRLLSNRIGGDCFAPDAPAGLFDGQDAVLVIGHDPAETSLRGVRADAAALRCLYDRVDAERGRRPAILVAPGAHWYEAWARLKQIATGRGWRYLPGPVDPWSLLDQVGQVFTLGDEIGFLALLRGIPVRCFARPFYAGWGVTDDDPTILPRGLHRSLAEIFSAACLAGTRYFDPFSGSETSFEATVDIVADWRRAHRSNRDLSACLGMSIWKQRRIRDLLRSSGGEPRFPVRAVPAVAVARRQGGAIAVWATREPARLTASAASHNVPVARIEDGFIRSVGLGADFLPGASIVIDRSGIYFDPSRPSDLDEILEHTQFDAAMIDRARRLIQLMVARGITKYNTGGDISGLDAPVGRHRLFVPGQVENDRSVRLGGAGISTNRDLLARVRALNPDAFIVYKPHPDVDAGYRPGAIPDDEAGRLADLIVRGVSSAALIAVVDEVHTLTSLAGFEALIRNRPVTAYGQPFYAGWGLTRDLAPVAHRTRRLSLEELVAGALILYPRYIDPLTRLPCGPEILIERLSDPMCWRGGPLVTLRRLQGEILRKRQARRIEKAWVIPAASPRSGG